MSARLVNDELRRQADNESVARHLATEGRETQATVTRLFTGLGYVVNYEYTVDDRTFDRGTFVASEFWKSLEVGSTLPIRYLPSDPHQAYPNGVPPNSENHWSTVLPMAGMILFFMVSFAAVFLSSVLPQRRLLACGSAAQGTVTRCKAGNRGRSSGYYLYYDFSLPEGGRCQGKDFRGEPIAEGSPVTVLYAPDRPGRSALYPIETVRVAAG
jgi:hypothetical protein